jgi:hypothetical protein
MSRCIAYRLNGEQCTKNQKEGSLYCGIHDIHIETSKVNEVNKPTSFVITKEFIVGEWNKINPCKKDVHISVKCCDEQLIVLFEDKPVGIKIDGEKVTFIGTKYGDLTMIAFNGAGRQFLYDHEESVLIRMN